ncbi:putative helicase [Neonectria ditissima]|uniref:Putative helicase n=1 Tax=Neonectria ditissima TaxID=78410 RepID=A0A0P7BBJ3_9HYPO|nr:putative helicase [Neonectria ditissima]
MSPKEVLLRWYSTLHTFKVDIVGDFAGVQSGLSWHVFQGKANECVVTDFNTDGLQLLHAVFAVEKFLDDLQKRGCNFDILFFRDLDEVCVLEGAATADAYKYHLFRAVVIQHLSRSNIRSEVHEFDAFESDDFKDYLSSHTLHFVLCDEGDGDEGPKAIQLRHLIWKLSNSGRHVGLVNHITWQTSKVFVHLLSRTREETAMGTINLLPYPVRELSTSSKAIIDAFPEPDANNPSLTLREWVAIHFCRGILGQPSSAQKVDEDTLNRLHGLLLHMATLRLCCLQERRCDVKAIGSGDECFLRSFSEVSKALIERGLENCGLDWDLFDLIDGRVFSFMLDAMRTNSPVSETIAKKAKDLWKEVVGNNAVYSDADFDVASRSSMPAPSLSDSEKTSPTILAFDHPAFNKFLGDITVEEVQETANSAAGVVFEDLEHWHRNKPVNSLPRPGFFAKRQNQRQMADIITYAESLQSGGGKILEREPIVVRTRTAQNKGAKPLPVKDSQKKGGKKPGRKGAKGGKENALKVAQEIQDRKIQDKRDSAIRLWVERCAEFQKDPNLASRYLKAQKFLFGVSRKEHWSLGPEVHLYLCHILSWIWAEACKNENKLSSQGLYLISMMWNSLQAISRSEDCTPEVADAMRGMVVSLRMPQIDVTVGNPSRALPFFIDTQLAKHVSKLVQDYRILQLEHGGPYMERRFDSKPDPRVPFEPDAWQRKVLDSIDANESLLVVAPTSAGKTFISFYAMKSVLEESDDAVLVYVAPTKALVNQIAAEIEGRFSKSYHGKPGKSVWAIHTRDYRINSPTGCQILVTVPHILQIMLLSPANANHPNAWSRRVRRIIFDEVHCIGQADDGVVWEQLLLLAPCPIIALSATVGNPDEFRDWLRVSRTQKDSKMTMIVHGVRYSDLRKFIYRSPPGKFIFDGLQKVPRLPVPGLDEGDAVSSRFQFVHPISALKDRNRETLDDLSLEARDCLTLWGKMNETLPPGHLKEKVDALSPDKALPQQVSKYDIVEWEKGLKAILREVMEASKSPLTTLQTSLEREPEQENPEITATTKTKSVIRPNPEPDHVVSLFPLVCELHSQDALPAIAFSYDRLECERAATYILKRMEEKEHQWKGTNTGWLKKIKEYKKWLSQKASACDAIPPTRSKTRGGDAENMTKLDLARDAASTEISIWESFDPNAPLEDFSFADSTKMQKSDLDAMIRKLKWADIRPELLKALERGMGVHHAGMNRKYRQVVEMLFRRGYLRVVIATGTLALGINMPCKTVIFTGDSIFLTAQNYRQASGRAGRRGFDLLGNVVFNGLPRDRVHEIMSSRLPALKGQFPISTTLILRLLGLLHSTDNSDFAKNAVQALLSQTRLYLGGPDAELSVKHHLRFSIEYLRRQNLLSANGKPLNFAGLVGHLYFTENSVFAFHSLLRGGYFHRLCADIYRAPERVLLEMMLVLSHLFDRFPVHRTKKLVERAHRSPSVIFLPRLPVAAETILIQHNKETLSIFRDYVHSYISQHLIDKPDRTMPFTQTVVGPSEGTQDGFFGRTPTTIRSPFVALSGFGDKFDSIQELCSTVRAGLFLEESAIPYIPIWPHDTDVEFNAYILDFYKHGSMVDLVRDNQIKGGDVWFFLQDFSRTLAAIETSLRGLAGLEAKDDEEEEEDSSDGEDLERPASVKMEAPRAQALAGSKKTSSGKAKVKVLDSWDDGSSDSESEAADSVDSLPGSPLLSKHEGGGGLMLVLGAFTMLKEEFDTKFRKVWA